MSAREATIAAVKTWIGTPYHHRAKLKGYGVDCGQLIIAAFAEAGHIEDFETGDYTCDWHLHRSQEKYLSFVERHLVRVDDSEDLSVDERLILDPNWTIAPGDVVVFRVGRTFSHGGVCTGWPNMVHSYFPAETVEECSLLADKALAERPMRVYTFEGYGS